MGIRALSLSKTPLRRFDDLRSPRKPSEQRLLRLASHPAADDDRLRRLRTAAEDPGLDWPYIFRTADAHRITPLASHHLARCGAALPEAVARTLRDQRTAIQRSGLLLVTEARRVIDALESAGVRPLLIKGPALAAQAWAQPGLRHSGDIDLLVRRGDAMRAVRVVRESGFARHGDHTDEPLNERYLRIHREAAFQRRIGAHAFDLEIKWALTDDSLPFACTGLGQETAVVRASGASFRTLSPADHAALLFHHGCRHYWSRLAWIADIAAVMENPGFGLDWPAFLSAARGDGRLRQVLVGCAMAQGVLGAKPPESVSRALLDDPRALRLARMAAGWLFAEPPVPHYVPYNAFLTGLAETRRQQAELWWRWARRLARPAPLMARIAGRGKR